VGRNRHTGPGGTDIAVQLAQAYELEAKLAEEYQQVRLMRATIAREASARGERTHKLGRQAHKRINVDLNVDDPHTLPRAIQNRSGDATPGHARTLDT
jgi:hypothetical protein